MSHYAAYLKEHHGDSLVETDSGFAVYRYLDKETVYIVDIYVIPEDRNKGSASAIADEVVRRAKIMGCKKLLGTVVPSAKNSTASLRVLLGYGMRLLKSSDNCVVFEKDI